MNRYISIPPSPADLERKENRMANLWNRGKKEDEPLIPRLSSAPPSPSELSREGIPMSTLPSRAAEPVHHATDAYRTGGSATIGKSVVIKGQIYSREDLVIDGEVEGSVEAIEHRVVVGPNGKVNAGVKAREIMVQGSIKGDVEAGDKIDIRREAKLVGNIKTQRIVIEDGAYFKGSVDIQRGEPAKAPAPAPAGSPIPRPQTMAAPVSPLPQQGLPVDPAKR